MKPIKNFFVIITVVALCALTGMIMENHSGMMMPVRAQIFPDPILPAFAQLGSVNFTPPAIPDPPMPKHEAGGSKPGPWKPIDTKPGPWKPIDTAA